MQTSELHTLEDILTKGIKVGEQTVPVSCVFIPKIQRAYAQGRETESDVRTDFLESIFNILTSADDVSIELSFLFGSKQPVAKRSSEGFELLDGQQRTTTLFLLYWYMSMKELGKNPDFLSSFTYETRDTSDQFLKKITSSSFFVNLVNYKPSKAIKENKWFTDDFYCDPTVCAMLNMLDSIDENYKNRGCQDIYSRLSRLRFYVLMLEKFDMNDELYIKMNSRGLSLVPFENFKASVVKFMKAKERNGLYGTDEVKAGVKPFWFDFTTKIDAKWIDLFWKMENNSQEECRNIIEIDDKKIGIGYMNFFSRYLFTKAALLYNKDNEQNNDLCPFFSSDDGAESVRMREKFFGWNYYERIFLVEDYLRTIDKVLDCFDENWDYVKKTVNDNDSFNVFENVKFDINQDAVTWPQRVIFAAVTEFIERIPDSKTLKDASIQDNFKRMLRVVYNIVENTPIESIEPAISVIKACTEIIGASGAIDGNFYKSLATETFTSRNQQLSEEIEKAKEMFSENGLFDKTWEDAFIVAEHHPFFRGSVLFFFTPGIGDSSAFCERYNVVKEMFDKNGVCEEYRKDHVLIRAIIGTINYWENGLKNRYITENSEREKHLKILLTNYKEVQSMVCKYFEGGALEPFVEYCKKIIDNATPRDGEKEGFCLLFKRLVNDANASALLDWVHKNESAKKHFCVQYNRDSYLINIPNAWYDRIILDTERHLIIPDLVAKYNMQYDGKNQPEMIKGNVHDTFGWEIPISKNVGNYRLHMVFGADKQINFFISGPDLPKVEQMFANSSNDGNKVKILKMPYQFFKDIDEIKTNIDDVIAKLGEL